MFPTQNIGFQCLLRPILKPLSSMKPSLPILSCCNPELNTHCIPTCSHMTSLTSYRGPFLALFKKKYMMPNSESLVKLMLDLEGTEDHCGLIRAEGAVQAGE